MKLEFTLATPDKAEIIGSLVVQLTQEICERTDAQHFDIDLDGTVQRCEELLTAGYYAAIIGWSESIPVAVATITETYALNAGGRYTSFRSFMLFLSFAVQV